MAIKDWKSEIQDMMLSTIDNVNFHYEFIKSIGILFESNDYIIEQVIIMNEILNEEDANHMVYMTVNKNTDSFELAFPFDNSFQQRFSVNIIKINSVSIENFMGISVYKDVFNDTNLYFDKILLSIINSLIKTVEENGIY